jgi:hypothetical protein
MRYGLLANWSGAISCAALVFTITAYAITRVWETYKFRNGGQRAIERLRMLERGEPPEPKLAVTAELPLQVETEVQAVSNFKPPLVPELAAKPGLPLQVGTKVWAIRNFGPVKQGAPGMITGVADVPFFWWSRPAYLCTFADNIKIHARPKKIEEFDHGHSLEELEQPDFGSIQSQHMTLRTQQLLAEQALAKFKKMKI